MVLVSMLSTGTAWDGMKGKAGKGMGRTTQPHTLHRQYHIRTLTHGLHLDCGHPSAGSIDVQENEWRIVAYVTGSWSILLVLEYG